MKHLYKTGICFLCSLCLSVTVCTVSAQQSSTGEPSVNLRYFVVNNTIQYLLVQSRIKVARKFKPLPTRAVKLYLDSTITENLIARIITNESGEAKVIIPPALKNNWNNNSRHSFIAVMEPTSKEAEITTTIAVTKTKMIIDTTSTDGIHSIIVKVMFLENKDWLPAKDIEMKVGVKRLGGILSAGDEATYTTDSTGTASAEFKKSGLPGDQLGNFILVAKAEDNEQYGNLLVEKTVPWGVVTKPDKNFFDQRNLWTTRFRTPFWLLFMAYSIVIGVWGTIIYLVLQIIKIKRLGVKM